MIRFFLTAVISVVTGGTSLITVPVMMQSGVEPHVAVATNRLALVFPSLGGTVPFLGTSDLPRRRLPGLLALTMAGSVPGALLLVLGVAMILMASFCLTKRDAGLPGCSFRASRTSILYGGFFSGGYVALLMAAYVACFRITFIQAVADTKPINAASSLVASAVFAWEGLIDWKPGIVLGVMSLFHEVAWPTSGNPT